MNILFTRFPLESSYGGAEVQTLSLMEGLRKRGHTVEFLGSCPVLLSETKERNIPSTSLHIGPPPVTKWGAVSFAWRKQKMRRILEQTLHELQATHSTGSGQASYKLQALVMLSLSEKLLLTEHAAKRGVPVFWIEHDRIGRWFTQNPWLPSLRRASGYATTITVSELSRKMYLDLGWDKKRTIAIPNGIDLDRFLPSPKGTSSGPSPNPHLRLGCIARLSFEKGIDVLLRAIAPMTDVHLTIIGKGREEEAVKILATQLGVRERTAILPSIDPIKLYAEIDCLVLPSREHDPFGLVAAEAMAAGCPVIVTDACGIAEELTDGEDALIAKAGDADALHEAIEKMADLVLRSRLGKHGRKTAAEKFSIKKMVDAYEHVFTGMHA